LYSDGRRPFQLTLDVSHSQEGGTGSHSLTLSPVVTWRATDRLAFSLGPAYERIVNGWQYVTQVPKTTAAASVHYVLARLDQTTLSLVSRADFAFSRKLTLQLYAEPFLSAGRYSLFKQVREPRAARVADRVTALDRNATSDLSFDNPDFNLKAFNLNLVWRWEYRPGVDAVPGVDPGTGGSGDPGIAGPRPRPGRTVRWAGTERAAGESKLAARGVRPIIRILAHRVRARGPD